MRYAMSQGRYGWSVHIRRALVPSLSLCRIALKSEDFPASGSTEICRRCQRAKDNGAG